MTRLVLTIWTFCRFIVVLTKGTDLSMATDRQLAEQMSSAFLRQKSFGGMHHHIQVPEKTEFVLQQSSFNCKEDMRDIVHTKMICTIGPSSSSLESLRALIQAGMTGARFDLTLGDYAMHKEAVENLKAAIKETGKMCAVILDTRGPSVCVKLPENLVIELTEGQDMELTADTTVEPSPCCLPVEGFDFKSMKAGDEVMVGNYLAHGVKNASTTLRVTRVDSHKMLCLSGDHARLSGTVTCTTPNSKKSPAGEEVQNLKDWDQPDLVTFISLSCTQRKEDIVQLRAALQKSKHLKQVHIIAKIDTRQGLENFTKILHEADCIMLSRGDLGVAIPTEKVVPIQKYVLRRCNEAAKPVIVNHVMDSMATNPRPTRAEATDVANAVLDGADCILLGMETVSGRFPVETVRTVLSIAKEAELSFDNTEHFMRMQRNLPEPMTELLAVVGSAARSANTINAALIVTLTKSGASPRVMSSFRPQAPILAVFLPTLTVTWNQRWEVSGAVQARHSLLHSGVIPVLADPGLDPEKSALAVAMRHAKCLRLVRPGDQMVITQKIGNSRTIAIVAAR